MTLSAVPVGGPRAHLVAQLPVFDSHADSLQRSLDLGHDLGVRGPGHLDLERGLEGGLGALVFVCWVDPSYVEQGPGGAFERTRLLLREFHRLAARHPERVAFAGNAPMLAQARGRGAVGGIPGIEGGHSIEESLDNLRFFFDHGVRVMTLVWNNHLSWMRSCQGGAGAGVPEGLSEFGRDVVRQMNSLGMLVDVSHAGVRSFYDALETSDKPVIASHSGCMAINEHPRNLTDDQLRALASAGGVAGMVFCTPFLDADARAEEVRLRATDEYRALAGTNESHTFCLQSEFLQARARPLPAERFVEHLCHAVEIAGIDHVGLGSDFDGIQRAPEGLENASCYPLIAELLVARGFSGDDVHKVLGANMRRVFSEVTGPGTLAAEAPLKPFDDA